MELQRARHCCETVVGACGNVKQIAVSMRPAKSQALCCSSVNGTLHTATTQRREICAKINQACANVRRQRRRNQRLNSLGLAAADDAATTPTTLVRSFAVTVNNPLRMRADTPRSCAPDFIWLLRRCVARKPHVVFCCEFCCESASVCESAVRVW